MTKTIEEIGNIFIEECNKILMENSTELSDLTNSCLNKTDDYKNKYDVFLNKIRNRLPSRGITKEELELFIPHLNEYMGKLTKSIFNNLSKGKE